MIFNQQALQYKQLYLDSIHKNENLISQVVSEYIEDSFQLQSIKRVWNPGGGSTLYKIVTNDKNFLLKIKNFEIFVESKLESESEFINKPSLRHEYEFLKLLSNQGFVPQVVFYDERANHSFLAVEFLDKFNVVENMTAKELYEVLGKIYETIYKLYSQGIVHTDIHEHNICFRGNTPILIDFEEARFLEQDVNFSESLDIIGKNKYGDVGQFPQGFGDVGLTCFQRLKNVFKSLIKSKIPELIKECRFDNACPFNLDSLQEIDSRIYQSINFGDMKIQGQRPINDARLRILNYWLYRLGITLKEVRYLDIGSNLGMFCFEAAKYSFVKKSIGIEAYDKYVDLSQVLAFLYDLSQVNFYNLIAGEDNINSICTDADFITVLSVYHHIANKKNFLQDIKKMGAKYVLFEFATQERFYPERGSVQQEMEYIRQELGYTYYHILTISNDYKRPIVLFSDSQLNFYDNIFFKFFLPKNKICKSFLFIFKLLTTRYIDQHKNHTTI